MFYIFSLQASQCFLHEVNRYSPYIHQHFYLNEILKLFSYIFICD
jgi:hypothetical protein